MLGALPPEYAARLTERAPCVELASAGTHVIDALIAWDLDVPRILQQIADQLGTQIGRVSEAVNGLREGI